MRRGPMSASPQFAGVTYSVPRQRLHEGWGRVHAGETSFFRRSSKWWFWVQGSEKCFIIQQGLTDGLSAILGGGLKRLTHRRRVRACLADVSNSSAHVHEKSAREHEVTRAPFVKLSQR